MQMPKVTIENYKQVYDYFCDFQQSTKFIKRWYAFTQFAFRPRLHYATGSHKDLDLIRDKDYRHIYAFNHQDNWDGYVFFSVIGTIAPHDVGRIRAMATSACFETPFPKAFRNTGYIPVFLKSHHAQSRKHSKHPERLALVPTATKAAFECFTSVMLNHHQNIFICPEGTYNKGAPNTLLPLRSGTAEIAHRVAQINGPVAITAIGLAYGKKRQRFVNPRGASVYVNRSIFIRPEMTVDEITELLQKRLQSSVERAVELY